MEISIQTLWRTSSEQCELVFRHWHGALLRLWVQNRLVLEEEVYDMAMALRRAAELRTEWPRLVD